MTVHQLVVSTEPDGSEKLTVEPNERNLPPYAFDGAHSHALQIGSWDLLKLALDLRDHGYRVMSVTLVDRHFVADDSEDTQELQLELVTRLRSSDPDTVLSFAQRELSGLYVLNVQVRSTDGRGRVTLAQDGILDTPSEELARDVVHSISHTMNIGISA